MTDSPNSPRSVADRLLGAGWTPAQARARADEFETKQSGTLAQRADRHADAAALREAADEPEVEAERQNQPEPNVDDAAHKATPAARAPTQPSGGKGKSKTRNPGSSARSSRKGPIGKATHDALIMQPQKAIAGAVTSTSSTFWGLLAGAAGLAIFYDLISNGTQTSALIGQATKAFHGFVFPTYTAPAVSTLTVAPDGQRTLTTPGTATAPPTSDNFNPNVTPGGGSTTTTPSSHTTVTTPPPRGTTPPTNGLQVGFV